MFRTKKTKKNATALEPGDIIKISGEKYYVKENIPNHSYGGPSMHIVLKPCRPVTSTVSDQLSLFMPSYLPMTIYKK